MPFFSIIIPTYNRASLVPIAVQSVLNQTFSDFEIFVIDDGSTDNTKEVLAQFESDSRFKYIFQENAQESAARNHGLRLAQGKYACFLDSDDYFLPNHLEILKRKIDELNEPVAVVHTLATRVYADGKEKKQVITKYENIHPVYNIFLNELLIHSACVHRDITAKHIFRTDIFAGEDSEFFYRVALEYPINTIEEYTVVYVMHKGSGEHFYNSSSRYYFNRIRYLTTVSSNEEIKNVFPKNSFEKRISNNYFWFGNALFKEGKKKEAFGAVFSAIKVYPSNLMRRFTYSELLRFTFRSAAKN
jgi:glycosyltransferase involved in cell wall biosynthesis